jgi:type II secretory pathway predicted ATPase ExeA
MKAQFIALRSALDASHSEDTYAVRHVNETTWLRGSVAVARWICDSYGMDKPSMMETLVRKVEASVKLTNEDLGLTVVNLTRGGRL